MIGGGVGPLGHRLLSFSALRALAAWATLLVALAWADRILSAGGQAGGERSALRGALARIERANESAPRIVLLGSSTSRDWLPERSLAAIFGVPTDRVLDAHINGCHQDCTWAEVRRLLAEGSRFEVAVLGTNLFQLCEHAHTKRALQQRELLGGRDLPGLASLYAHSPQPLAHVGRFVGGAVSAVYADTTATQRELARRGLGRETPDLAWVGERPAAPRPLPRCAYGEADIAYKRAVSEALLDDLGVLADRTYLLLLPDVTLNSTDPADVQAWERHRELHRALARSREHVVLIDLAVPHPAEDYTDGMHLRPAAAVEQRRLFRQRLGESGEGGLSP